MADQIGIIRKATDEEKKDYIEVGNPKTLDLFLAQVSKKQQEYQKKFLPFDAACARVDFEIELERVAGELRLNPDANTSLFNKIDLDVYGDIKSFDFIDETDVVEDKLIDNMRQSLKIGVYRNYKCKKRGHGFSIFVPIEKLNEEKEVKTTKVE